MNIQQWLNHATKLLAQADIGTARLDCLILLEKALDRDRGWILAHQEQLLASEREQEFTKLLARRAKREPVAYISGICEFYGLQLEVTPEVLIPRVETEALVSYVLHNAGTGAQIIDLGTGSGAIALALRSKRPDLKLVASDESLKALAVAQRNAKKYSFHDIEFMQSNLMDDINARFDFIVANLPYLSDKEHYGPELAYEPVKALFSGPQGLDHYRRLFPQVMSHIHKGGSIVIEAEPKQAGPLDKLARENGLSSVEHANFLHIYRS